MARPREFDEEEVLDLATQAFRLGGFDGTSMADVEEAVGVGRQSLYNVYGDKAGLFLRVLDRYGNRGLAMARVHLDGSKRGMDAVESYLKEMIRFLTSDDTKQGCLVARTLMDNSGLDHEIGSSCSANLGQLNRLLAKALKEGAEDGELAESLSPETAASLIVTHVYGLSAVLRAGVKAHVIRKSSDALLRQLRTAD